jgi:hypothetical protein
MGVAIIAAGVNNVMDVTVKGWGILKLLEIYLSGSLLTMISVAAIAVKMRKVHGLRAAATFQLTVAAGSVWPLLMIAAVQVLALAMLTGGLDVLLGSRALHSAVDVDTQPVDLSVAT